MYTAKGTIDKQQWIEQFTPLVKRIAHHMMVKLPASVEVSDMIQAGLIGLLDAVNRYEESVGAQFETYAAQRIRGAMLDELRQSDWLPRGLRKTMRSIETAISVLEQRLGRAPSEPELARELGVSLAQYQEMLQEARGYQLLYYEDFDQRDEVHFLDHHCTDGRPDPLEALLDGKMRAELAEAIETLPEREKMMMGLYYEQELNLREIGEVLGVSESRVCQIHTQAIARLRSRLQQD